MCLAAIIHFWRFIVKKIIWGLIVAIALMAFPVYGEEATQTKVYFDKEALDPVVILINSAQDSIYIQMYGFTNYKAVIDAIESAVRGG